MSTQHRQSRPKADRQPGTTSGQTAGRYTHAKAPPPPPAPRQVFDDWAAI